LPGGGRIKENLHVRQIVCRLVLKHSRGIRQFAGFFDRYLLGVKTLCVFVE